MDVIARWLFEEEAVGECGRRELFNNNMFKPNG
jgi:hypothetical protein